MIRPNNFESVYKYHKRTVVLKEANKIYLKEIIEDDASFQHHYDQNNFANF